MPELPEVETIRNGLALYLVGHTILSIELRLPKMLTGDIKRVEGSKVIGVRRFGKGLVIDLDNDNSLAVHVKMTGQLIYIGEKVPKDVRISLEKIGSPLPNKATHIIFRLDRNATLYYNDVRQFGWVKIHPTTQIPELPFFKALGPEPDVTDHIPGRSVLTLVQFKRIVQSRKSPIKPLLLDQKLISGIGNIYANEALYVAKIHPMRQAASLTVFEIEKLFSAIEAVLKKGIEVGGSSKRQFVTALGEEGGYQKIFQIYDQEGKNCRICGEVIEKISLGGRGTFFCPNCQK